ncbi:hypothetical protein FK220_002005 [Flavobacteriaceae bacterium TP-CH-4]|uniref:DUF1330 domain-containing protein n=1 Tax=Pelagihabitans pacificus TaxID=2696054 RepID=A0A967E474_9FLAO|nr:hypothetical protein [Pelagihabitans pacificus]NHF58097.1 hypothetical protein [Pelagihabitans pacificus]
MGNDLYTDINPEALRALADFPDDRPLYMLNYMKYAPIDQETGKTGKEVYREYLAKATPFFENINARISFKAKPSLMIIGPEDEELWDEVLIVTYDTKAEFFKLIQMEGYPGHIRKKALQDSRIIFCQ